MKRFWTEEKITELLAMVDDGVPVRQMETHFGRSFEAMKLAARAYGAHLSKTCSCGRPRASLKDGLCPVCRSARAFKAKRESVRYFWNPEWDAQILRLKNCRSRKEYTAMLRHISKLTSVPVGSVKTHCARLGVYWMRYGTKQRQWTAVEDEQLRSFAGSISTKRIAHIVRRSHLAVVNRLWQLKVSGRISKGYSQKDIAELFGVSTDAVRKWINMGYLGPRLNWSGNHYRVSDILLKRFITKHPEEYDLRRVDQAWFKGMLFPNFGRFSLTGFREPIPLGSVPERSIPEGTSVAGVDRPIPASSEKYIEEAITA